MRVKVAIIDSGINATHPHVRSLAGGIGGTSPEGWTDDFGDRLGHGTAVAGVIREKAPDADLFSIKVFDRRLSTRPDQIVRALDWCRFHRMDVVNLSVCPEDASQCGTLKDAMSGLLVVGALHQLPEGLPGVIVVNADDSCPRDQFRYRDGVFCASPYPRPAPGVNYIGADFAVANMTGFLARALPSITQGREPIATIHKRLIEAFAALGEARPS